VEAGNQSPPWRFLEELAEGQEYDRERVRLLGTEVDVGGIPWALLAREQDGELAFVGPAIPRPPSHARAEWAEMFAKMAIERPALKGLRRANRAQWLRPEIRVKAQHFNAKGILRHATVLADNGLRKPRDCSTPSSGNETPVSVLYRYQPRASEEHIANS